ncbi:tuliposide A-converting enzyme 1, chloroplastic-like [Musa acuminata AAA Group]|uniref:tuliposide A-converting enzyme 1, chloroplastic-like n=1 Tax=Musa acuminata AAA Group TaxID=214697 RepID=UPI0031D4311D
MNPDDEIVYDTTPRLIRVFKSGRVERYLCTDATPASVDPATGVSSKDVLVSPETGVSARLYIPRLREGDRPEQKLPVLVYFHGGGFCLGSAFIPLFHNYLNSLVAQAHVVAVSADYRLAPEHPVPTAHDDSWTVLRWVAGHAGGGGAPAAEAWLAERADFERVFLAGESAGANIAHHMAMRAGIGGLPCGVRIRGVALIHPYFLGSDRVESAEIYPAATENLETLWRTMCPSSSGLDDPMINPVAEAAPSLAGLGCDRALVCVGGADALRDRGRAYYRRLRESGWEGEATLFEAEGKAHTFHLFETYCEEAIAQHRAVCSFLNL